LTLKYLDVKFVGKLPDWLNWETDSVLAGTSPTPNEGEEYKVPITLRANYDAYGMRHVIESQFELDIRSPTSGIYDLCLSPLSIQFMEMDKSTLESGVESHLNDDKNIIVVGTQEPLSSETNTLFNFYHESQSIGLYWTQCPQEQSPMRPAPPSTGPDLCNISLDSLNRPLSLAPIPSNPHDVGFIPQTFFGSPCHVAARVSYDGND
jgi:hypothetical protein